MSKQNPTLDSLFETSACDSYDKLTINLNAWGDMIIDPYVISHRTLTNFEKALNQERFSEFRLHLSDDRDPLEVIHIIIHISKINGVAEEALRMDQDDPCMLLVHCYSIWFDDSGCFHRGDEMNVSDLVLKKGFPPSQGEWDFMKSRDSYMQTYNRSFVEYLPLTLFLLDDPLVHQWWHRETKGAFIPHSVLGGVRRHDQSAALSNVLREKSYTGSSALEFYAAIQGRPDDDIYYSPPSQRQAMADAQCAYAVPKIQKFGNFTHGLFYEFYDKRGDRMHTRRPVPINPQTRATAAGINYRLSKANGFDQNS